MVVWTQPSEFSSNGFNTVASYLLIFLTCVCLMQIVAGLHVSNDLGTEEELFRTSALRGFNNDDSHNKGEGLNSIIEDYQRNYAPSPINSKYAITAPSACPDKSSWLRESAQIPSLMGIENGTLKKCPFMIPT